MLEGCPLVVKIGIVHNRLFGYRMDTFYEIIQSRLGFSIIAYRVLDYSYFVMARLAVEVGYRKADAEVRPCAP